MPSRCRDRRRGAASTDDAVFMRPPRTVDQHFVDAVDLLEPHLHALLQRRRQVLADVVRLDRQLAMAAVDEHDQLDGARPAEVDERVERGANRPAGVEHVVDQQDPPVVDRERNLGAAHDRLRPDGMAHQVVAVERDVERAGRHLVAVDVAAGFGRCGAPAARRACGCRRARARCVPRFRSRISCAMRVSARDMRSASITWGMRASGNARRRYRTVVDGLRAGESRFTSSRTLGSALKSQVIIAQPNRSVERALGRSRRGT